jgi:hypothetical protein
MNKKAPVKQSKPSPLPEKKRPGKDLPDFSWYVELCQELSPATLAISSVDNPAIWQVDSFLKAVMDGWKEHHQDILEEVNLSPMELLEIVITSTQRNYPSQGARMPEKFLLVLWERMAENIRLRNEVLKNFPGKAEAAKKLRERGLMR